LSTLVPESSIGMAKYWYRILVSHTGIAYWYRILVSHTGIAYWYRILVSHTGIADWYHIRLPSAVKAEEVDDMKRELIKLFKSREAPEMIEETLNIVTPLEPLEVGAALDRLIIKYRGATIVAGAKTE
jgi:hypothetical protein